MRDSMFQELFKNPFAREEYTLVSLCLFGADTGVRLESEFPDAAAAVNSAVARAVDEDADVALTLGEQKGFTVGVDRFLASLRKVMEDSEDALSVALGGRDSEGFKAFYPKGRSEFTRLSRKAAPAVMTRISKAVNTYAARLDARLRSALLQLEVDWKAARGVQQSKMAGVGTNRVERQSARQQLEEALWDATLAVLLRYRKETEKAQSFFRDELLKSAKRRKKDAANA